MPIRVWLSLFALLTTSVHAQMRGGGSVRGGPAGAGSSSGARGAGLGRRPPRPRVGGGGFRGGARGFGAGYYGAYGYGFFDPLDYPALSYGAPEEQVPAQAPQPNVIVVAPAAPPADVQRPPVHVGPVVLELAPPTNTAAPSNGPPRPFEIVLKDGTVRQAIGVVADTTSKMLKYVDPDGENLQIPLDTVDRSATRRINQQQNLTLWLP